MHFVGLSQHELILLLHNATQLVISAIFASIVGYERETRGHPAGLRTHVLVGVGSTLFTLASIGIAEGSSTEDKGRIAAQIVSGIGFLGAGTIIHRGSMVRGLTTAASLWAVAGVGLAIGVGGRMIAVAIAATAVIYLTLTIFRRLETWLETRRGTELKVVTSNVALALHELSHSLEGVEFSVLRSEILEDSEPAVRILVLRLDSLKAQVTQDITTALSASPEIISVEWE